ncbi:MAG: hypothetical protein MUE85_01410 [Microscillaceae bacterium]|jgi:hypothetical protein|nr:hypothetical protein [Microscillaceae bacterium]
MKINLILKTLIISLSVFLLLLLVVNTCSYEPLPDYEESLDSTIQMDSTFEAPAYVVKDWRIKEASGLVYSRNLAKALWTHNDSGDEPRIFLISPKGKFLAQFRLPNHLPFQDVEDICIGGGPIPNQNYIYLGDIGDNKAQRDVKYIYRFLEPKSYKYKQQGNIIAQVETIRFRYEDGKRDAETLMIDPLTKDLYIVSKREKQVNVYILPYPQKADNEVLTAKKIATLHFSYATGGDILANGEEIIIKNYVNIYYWRRKSGESLTQTFQRPPVRVAYLFESQGEGIAWALDGSGYYTLSETVYETRANIYFYRRKD